MDFTYAFKQFAAALVLAVPLAVAAQPAKPAIPPTPEKPVALPADEPDVQMSEEELAKQRKEEEAEARKKAAEDALAERQRQREERLSKCVIKMVMTDQEIDYCRVAYRD
jgi:hypothetical protein